jgi:arylsulfatase A-like enzyme
MMSRVRGRERRVAVLGALIAMVTAVGVLAGPPVAQGRDVAEPAAAREGKGRPNILLITTDDQTLSDLRWMPKTRKLLGRQGVTFPNALSPHPICCPARAAILTGQYAQNNGVRSNQGKYAFAGLKRRTTLPVWLKRAGYRTAFTGKYLNGYGTQGRPQPGWGWFDPTIVGQYNYNDYVMYRNGNPKSYHGLHNVDYINGEVERLVREWSPGSKPFFIWASHVAPHGRLDPAKGIPTSAVPLAPKRYRGKFRNTRSPSLRDRAFNEADISDKNAWLRRKRPHGLPVRKVNHTFRERIRTLQAVDQGVGRAVRALRLAGELDNTYVVFTSDNGFLMGEHRLMTKNLPYQQSIRVPLLMRGPKVPHGKRRAQLATMIDLAPTFADIAGARPNLKVDGVSLLPTLRRSRPLRDNVLIQAGPHSPPDRPYGWWWRGVTTPRYTYAYFHAEGFEELYDRRYDPAETTNVAGHPFYRRTVAELRRRAVALKYCAGAASCSRRWPGVPGPLLTPLR